MDWLSEADVLDGAAARGCRRPSVRQLRRWRAGLLVVSPIRVWLGRGRGSLSAYPPYAVDQVVAATRAVRRGRPLQISLVLAALDSPVPPPGFAAALLFFWRLFHTALPADPDQRAYEVQHHVAKIGVRTIRGLSRAELADGVGTLMSWSLDDHDAPTAAGFAALRKLTEQSWRTVAPPLGIPNEAIEQFLAELSSQDILDLWSDDPFVKVPNVEGAVTTASNEELATAIRKAAARLELLPTGRQSMAERALALAVATCKVLAERSSRDLGRYESR